VRARTQQLTQGYRAGAMVMPLMQQGLRTGLIKFNLLTCTKPL
jgi:hypothetical protein